MTAQIILFPGCEWVRPLPTFSEWMQDQIEPGKKWVVVKVRRYGGKFQFDPDRHVLLLQREYAELEARYQREIGRSAR